MIHKEINSDDYSSIIPGTLPRDAPFTMHAAVINYFRRGGFYPVGGASQIAFNIIPVIEKSGGRVLVRASVSEILIDDKGHAKGTYIRSQNYLSRTNGFLFRNQQHFHKLQFQHVNSKCHILCI